MAKLCRQTARPSMQKTMFRVCWACCMCCAKYSIESAARAYTRTLPGDLFSNYLLDAVFALATVLRHSEGERRRSTSATGQQRCTSHWFSFVLINFSHSCFVVMISPAQFQGVSLHHVCKANEQVVLRHGRWPSGNVEDEASIQNAC